MLAPPLQPIEHEAAGVQDLVCERCPLPHVAVHDDQLPQLPQLPQMAAGERKIHEFSACESSFERQNKFFIKKNGKARPHKYESVRQVLKAGTSTDLLPPASISTWCFSIVSALK